MTDKLSEVEEVKLAHRKHLKGLNYDYNDPTVLKVKETKRGNLYHVMDTWGTWYYVRNDVDCIFLAFKNSALKTTLLDPAVDSLLEDEKVNWEDDTWTKWLGDWLQNDDGGGAAPSFGTSESMGFTETFGHGTGKKKKKEKLASEIPLSKDGTYEKVIWVRPKKGKPYQRKIKVDPEHMREIGKVGFAATKKKIEDMIRDPNADPEEVERYAKWFARRIKQTTIPYRRQWWQKFRQELKTSKNRDVAQKVASEFIREISGH